MLLFCLCSTFIFAQLKVPETPSSNDKNSLTMDINSDLGLGIKYDRQLIQKGKYSLMGQVGATLYPPKFRFNTLGMGANFNAALYNRITFNEHNFEIGAGVIVGKYFQANVENSPFGVQPWRASPYIHMGYLYQPEGKNWFLRANMRLSHYSNGVGIRPNMSFGLGYKF